MGGREEGTGGNGGGGGAPPGNVGDKVGAKLFGEGVVAAAHTQAHPADVSRHIQVSTP
jgi:hypothetical protein